MSLSSEPTATTVSQAQYTPVRSWVSSARRGEENCNYLSPLFKASFYGSQLLLQNTNDLSLSPSGYPWDVHPSTPNPSCPVSLRHCPLVVLPGLREPPPRVLHHRLRNPACTEHAEAEAPGTGGRRPEAGAEPGPGEEAPGAPPAHAAQLQADVPQLRRGPRDHEDDPPRPAPAPVHQHQHLHLHLHMPARGGSLVPGVACSPEAAAMV